MMGEAQLGHYDDTPVFTIKTVTRETGIAPATLRAWERRYNFLSPGRSNGGYRLYSRRDIAILNWLKDRVDAGVSISQAVALLKLRHRSGAQPEQEALLTSGRQTDAIQTPTSTTRSTAVIKEDLLQLLLGFREPQAELVLGEAFALYPVETVIEELIAPVLVEIGERWHSGEATVIQEHFATEFLRRRLTALFGVYEQPPVGPLAITGSAPSEWHDIGILSVSVVLRRHGWRVIYLGQNVPAEQLLEEIRRLRPDLVCLSAATPEAALALSRVYETTQALPLPRPRLVLGGRAFNTDPNLQSAFPGAYIGARARDLLVELGQI